MPTIDTLSPSNVGEDRVVLTLNAAIATPRSLQSVIIDIDYSAAAPEGITPPIEILFKSALDPESFGRSIFLTRLPEAFSFSPGSSGNYLILLRELGHNRWQGRLEIEVIGDEFSRVDTVERR